MNRPLRWSPGETPSELHPLLRELAVDYPIRESGEGALLSFRRLDDGAPMHFTVSHENDRVAIGFGSVTAAARAIGFALAGEDADETGFLATLGVEFDCSRGTVMTVEAFKRNARRLALLGYNLIMLYTVDVYELDGVPSFGFMRGRYSAADIRAMDDCAHALGIELIGSLQALGHLDQFLRRGINARYRDTESELMVGVPQTADLLDRMFAFWSANLRSRRIHVGMDETHTLGRGRYLDLNGYEPMDRLYNRHLELVRSTCARHGLKPMLWSDMYFKMGNPKCDYYDLDWQIPPEVAAGRPKEVQLVYWDYYHFDEAFYAKMIDRHVTMLGQLPVVAPCVRTCKRMWHDHRTTVDTIGPCLAACRAKGIREVIVTLWNDDQLFCDPESTYGGLFWTADRVFGTPEDDPARDRRFAALCRGSWELYTLMATIDGFMRPHDHTSGFFVTSILWDDPLMGFTFRRHRLLGVDLAAYTAKLHAIAGRVAELPEYPGGARREFALAICGVLAAKLELRLQLEAAWRAKDRDALRRVADEAVPAAVAAVERYRDELRRDWFRHYRPQGLESMQIRLAGVIERCRETARRIEEYLAGGLPLAELDEPDDGEFPHVEWRYRLIATGIGVM